MLHHGRRASDEDQRRTVETAGPPRSGGTVLDGGAADARAGGPLRQGLSRTFASLAVFNFRLLWFGMLFTMAATQISLVSRAWLAYTISGSGAVLGMVALARGFPQFCLAPYGGVAADRFNKRTLLIVSQVVMAGLAAVVAALVQTHRITIWELVVIGFCQGAVFPFLMPTRTAYISDLVDDERLPNALALDASGRNLNRVIAPTLAGFLIALSPALAFWAVTIFFLLSTATLMLLPNPAKTPFRSRGAVADMLVGFRYIRERRGLMILIGMAFIFALLGMPYSQLLPVFQQSVFHVGAPELGFMYTAVGLGAIIGSLTSAYLADSTRKRTIQLIVGGIFGVALALFAIAPHYLVGLPFLLLAGGMVEAYFTLNRILVIMSTDKAVYGRVIAIYSMAWSLVPISLLAMGFIVDRVGAPATVAVAGLLLTLVVIGLAAFVPSIRRAGEEELAT